MMPAKVGSADEFWRLAAGVDLGEAVEEPRRGHAYYPSEGWVAYTLSHFHGSDLYLVKESEAIEAFEAVKVSLLESSERDEDTEFTRGFHEWRSQERGFQTPCDLYFAIRRAQRQIWYATDGLSATIADQEESSFWRRWRHLKWYWANYVFEWTYLTGLTLFLVWPGIRGLSIDRWAVHLGLGPFAFMIPMYLGYATFSYTSAGLSGGIVYPYLIRATAYGHCNRWDRWLLAHCPPIIEPLSAPIGEWVSISGGGMPGPTSVVKFGLLIAVVVVSILPTWRWFLSRRKLPSKSGANASV